jgi:hypothetical protein
MRPARNSPVATALLATPKLFEGGRAARRRVFWKARIALRTAKWVQVARGGGYRVAGEKNLKKLKKA